MFKLQEHGMNKSLEDLPQRETAKCGKNISDYFKQYCDSTSIHGFRYFGENRSIFEKVWWSTVFTICLSCCGYMIFKIYEKYDTSPVLVSFSTKETPVYQIPFPAVTICPETKAVKTKFDYTQTIRKKMENKTLTPEENKYLQYMAMLCDTDNLTEFLESEMKNSTFDASSILSTLDEVRPTIGADSIITSCYFLMSDNKCVERMVPVITDEGVCYSFNLLDRSEVFSDLVSHYGDYHLVENDNTGQWNPESGYADPKDLELYPSRAFMAGASKGLTVELATLKRDLDFVCKQIQGFKVVLHAPFRVPKLKQEYFRVPLDQDVIAAVRPVMITTSDKVKSFDVEKRNCYFSSEKILKYFKFYSQQNCQLECITNITLNKCDCVKIHMPRENSTQICGPVQQDCIKLAEEAAILAELGFLEENVTDLLDTFFGVKYCGCLPLCTDTRYDSETSQTEWNWEEKFRLLGNKKFSKEKMHLSRLTVYFKFNYFITSERQELYGPTDFVANFGGLLGLFTGFSILSLMEIIYFMTVRICCNIRLYGRWTGTEQ